MTFLGCDVNGLLGDDLLTLTQRDVVEVVLVCCEAELLAKRLDFLQRVDAGRQDEEDWCRRPRLLVRLGELQRRALDVLVSQVLLDVRRHGIRHTVWSQRAHHAQLLQRRLVLPLLRELLLLGTLALNELLPALGRAGDIAVEVVELLHQTQRLDAAPAAVRQEVER